MRLGKLGTQLALDTGDESNINLSYEFYQEHQELFSATEQRKVAGVGGTSIELMGTIPGCASATCSSIINASVRRPRYAVSPSVTSAPRFSRTSTW